MLSIDHPLSDSLFEQFAKKIEAETGLSFQGSKKRDLRLAVRKMAESIGAENDAECIDWLLSGRWEQAKMDLCARHLTIGETYFFRETRAFNLVSDYAREKIMAFGARNAHLRIWSAGCCTGEEAYSIAMALRQSVPQLPPEEISILGTDINRQSLQVARAGVYRQWSFRNTDAALRKSAFVPAGEGQCRLNDEIRDMVQFAELNLAAPAYPSIATATHAMDIIFCRNVLMYFSRAQALKVIQRFRQSLVEGGWLVVSPSEASAELFAGFEGVYYPDAIFFRKTSTGNPPMVMRHDLRESSSVDGEALSLVAERQDRPGQAADGALAAGGVPASMAGRQAGNRRVDARVPGNTDREKADAPVTAELFHARALAAMESGRHAEAMQNLKRVLYLQPDSIIAHYLMGVAHSAQGNRHAASKQFEMAHRLLDRLADEDVVPESDGISAAYLRASVQAFCEMENK